MTITFTTEEVSMLEDIMDGTQNSKSAFISALSEYQADDETIEQIKQNSINKIRKMPAELFKEIFSNPPIIPEYEYHM